MSEIEIIPPNWLEIEIFCLKNFKTVFCTIHKMSLWFFLSTINVILSRSPNDEEYEISGVNTHHKVDAEGGNGDEIGGDYYMPADHRLVAEERPAEASTYYLILFLMKLGKWYSYFFHISKHYCYNYNTLQLLHSLTEKSTDYDVIWWQICL